MAKKIKFESFVYRFLVAAREAGTRLPSQQREAWDRFLLDLDFRYEGAAALLEWRSPAPGRLAIPLDGARLYVRGDTPAAAERLTATADPSALDVVRAGNETFFAGAVETVATTAGFNLGAAGAASARLATEEAFHDQWAEGAAVDAIDVIAANEVCTAPEMRFITQRLGDLRGKRLLDVGCGLGEASVYFAVKGAQVTATDLSQGMLDATRRLAERNGVTLRTHKAAAESLLLEASEQFDVIYAGNLLHHVDIEKTLNLLRAHLAPGGWLVTWDPLAYNPVINVYRRMATAVRTPDEHPLTLADLRLFRRLFPTVETRYFWLTTLVIFVLMAVFQRRDPNQERYWKSVVSEADRWAPLYTPLESVDRFLLTVLPFLRPLCWNVVIFARND